MIRSRADLFPMSNPAFLRVGRAPFVGRGRELALLANSLEEARAAHAGIVLLAGEPGIGKTRLLEEFAGDDATCLFATMGFWQGVDVPGRSLSQVVIDKLPFARPDDPLLDARREKRRFATRLGDFTHSDVSRRVKAKRKGGTPSSTPARGTA